MSAVSKRVENCIRAKLQHRFFPKVLRLVNESRMHNVPDGAETHFKVVVVSEAFAGVPLIKVLNERRRAKRVPLSLPNLR